MTTIPVILILILYAAVLELSKNTIAGWLIAILIALFWFGVRAAMKAGMTWNRGRSLAAFLILIALLGLNLFLTRPPERRVRAVDSRHPVVTETVRIRQGDLTGVYNADHTARVYAGIPYAAPPVGGLRWKEPQAPEGWDGIRAFDTFGPMAMQQRSGELYNSLTRILGFHDFRISLRDNYREAMSEDCLYLNVFTPAEDYAEPLPVLFFIHGVL